MKKKIMVIDDEDAVRNLMKRILAKSGYDIRLASNGKEALDMLESMNVDLIMLDMNMPQMDGLTFLKNIRSENITNAPVLMVSGEDDPENIVKCYKLGVYDFIKKPERTEIMLKRVENGLKIGEILNFNEFIKVELLMAKKLQKYLFPKPSIETGDINIHTWSRPLSDIGGDLYDYIVFRDNRIIFFVADVSGHSISAALYTAIVKMVFRNALQKTVEPSEIVSIMNQELSGNIPIEAFVTMFCGLIDTNENIIEYANAGHPKPFCLGNRGIAQLEGNDSFLGPIEDARYSTYKMDLNDVSSILAYTDGILDITDDNDDPVGIHILNSALGQEDKSPIEKFHDIQKRITCGDFTLTDDCTLMLVNLNS